MVQSCPSAEAREARFTLKEGEGSRMILRAGVVKYTHKLIYSCMHSYNGFQKIRLSDQ